MELDIIRKMFISGRSLKIVAFGDSFTYGWMVSRGYLDFLRDMLRQEYPECSVSILNRGMPGDTAENGLYRLTSHVLDEDPDLVLIQFGLNDAYLGYSPDVYRKNILSMVERIRNDTCARVLLLTSNYLPDERENRMAEDFYRRLTDISREQDVPVVPVHEYWREKVNNGTDHDSLVQGDRVHPTVEGYRLMAESIMKMLRGPGQ